jgi:hypothetical protein
MNSPHDTRRFRIVNTVDRPEPRLIAELRDDGLLYYLHRRIRRYTGLLPQESTPVEDFGIALTIIGNTLYGTRTGVSKATYLDGRPRQWQGDTEFNITLPTLPI